ncbi:hypothetical protein [Nitrospira sp. Kam-Ns4a]
MMLRTGQRRTPRVEPCPKCYHRWLFERYDQWLGSERYCPVCGWTPLTALWVHQPDPQEVERIATLRHLLRRYAYPVNGQGNGAGSSNGHGQS